MDISQRIQQNVIDGAFTETESLVRAALDAGRSPNQIIQDGLMVGMNEVGRRFREQEYFMPEVLMCAQAMSSAFRVLRPLLVGEQKQQVVGTVVFGTVQGDVHDIGKNIVSMMLEGAGFKVVDLGTNVKPERFIEAVREVNPEIVAMCALLSTTMTNFRVTIEALRGANLRDRIKVMVGGAPVTEGYAYKSGADGWAPNAAEAVVKAKELLGLPMTP